MQKNNDDIIKVLEKYDIDISNIDEKYLLNILDKIIDDNNKKILDKREEVLNLLENI